MDQTCQQQCSDLQENALVTCLIRESNSGWTNLNYFDQAYYARHAGVFFWPIFCRYALRQWIRNEMKIDYKSPSVFLRLLSNFSCQMAYEYSQNYQISLQLSQNPTGRETVFGQMKVNLNTRYQRKKNRETAHWSLRNRLKKWPFLLTVR